MASTTGLKHDWSLEFPLALGNTGCDSLAFCWRYYPLSRASAQQYSIYLFSRPIILSFADGTQIGKNNQLKIGVGGIDPDTFYTTAAVVTVSPPSQSQLTTLLIHIDSKFMQPLGSYF